MIGVVWFQVDAEGTGLIIARDERLDTSDISGAPSTGIVDFTTGCFVGTSMEVGGVGRKVIAMAVLLVCMHDFKSRVCHGNVSDATTSALRPWRSHAGGS